MELNEEEAQFVCNLLNQLSVNLSSSDAAKAVALVQGILAKKK